LFYVWKKSILKKERKSTMATTGRSNAASVVGRYVTFLDTLKRPRKNAVIVAYDPKTNEHSVELEDGTEKTLIILNKQRFKWHIHDCEAAVDIGWDAHQAGQRDVVGRKVKVFSKKSEKYFHGTIIGFNESSTAKHKVRFEKNNQVQELNLERLKWRYTDLIGNRLPGSHSITASKYAGVKRTGESRWTASSKGSGNHGYIGQFTSEKDAALAHDFYARKEHRMDINFQNEQISEADIQQRRTTQCREGVPPSGKSKFRGVHWQVNRKRWMARYTLSHRGEKNINLGSFDDARYAALAFDAEARKRGRPGGDLNFPGEHPSDSQIEEWKMNTTHYSMMGSSSKKSSQYRGVTFRKTEQTWHVQINIKKIVEGMGKTKGPVSFGSYAHEKQAALVYDWNCRRFGIIEKELNFPRDDSQQLKEVRLFDDECYFCHRESPTDPVATPCNHIFCRACVVPSLQSSGGCPCCQRPIVSEDELRPVELVPWPKPDKPRKRKRSSRANDPSEEMVGDDNVANHDDDQDVGEEDTGCDDDDDDDDDEGRDRKNPASDETTKAKSAVRSEVETVRVGTRFIDNNTQI
jgi:hypothetical protein